MKMTTAHQAALLALISSTLDRLAKERYQSIAEFIEAYKTQLGKAKVKCIDTRLRWDLLWAVPFAQRSPLFDELYEYLNDDHIDTALKKIVKELTEKENA